MPATTTSVKATSGAESQLSLAVAVPVAAGNVLVKHAIVTFAGQVTTGATLSSTTIV